MSAPIIKSDGLFILDLTTQAESRGPAFDIDLRCQMLQKQLKDPNMAHQHRNFAAALAKYATGAFPTVKEPWYFLVGQLYPSMPAQIPYGAGLLREVRLRSITRSFPLT